jgi:topoisomerase-4 subunit A
MGNQVTKYPIKSVKFKEAGRSTLSGKKFWFDDQFGRLNTESKGTCLGSFDPEDKIIVFYHDGQYEITDQELTQRFDPEQVELIEKFDPEKIVTAVYLDKEKLQYNIKRFKIETTTLHNKFSFIKEGEGNYLEAVTTDEEPILAVQSGRGAQVRKAKFKVVKLVEVMGWKAVGAKLVDFSKNIEMEWERKAGDNKQAELFE